MNSFYGGQPGQSFKIKKVFNSKESLEADLKLQQASPISVGEFVMIAYGLPNNGGTFIQYAPELDENNNVIGDTFPSENRLGSYEENRALDADEGKTYNATLWQKVFTNGASLENGIAYTLIASLAGNTPVFKVNEVQQIEVNEKPYIEIDNTEIDTPKLTLHMPKNWDFNTDIPVEELAANGVPSARLEKDSVTSKATIHLALPQAQVMGQPTHEVLAPNAEPTVSFDTSSTTNQPILKFLLPRNTKFFSGNLLGLPQNYLRQDKSQYSGMESGDYYINQNSGRIYSALVTATIDFTYEGCLQSNIPTADTREVVLYKKIGDTWVVNELEVNRQQNINDMTWNLTFDLPKAPIPKLSASFLGSEEEGTASLAIDTDSTYVITLAIPEGTRIYSGNQQDRDNIDPVTIKVGDIFIDTETGYVYRYQSDSSWLQRSGSLTGPPLNIVATYVFNEANGDVFPTDVGAYIEEHHTEKAIDSSMLFSITDIRSNAAREDFWYYKDKTGVWNYKLLTGGAENFVANEKIEDTSGESTTKAYSVKYVNAIDQRVGADKTDIARLDEELNTVEQDITRLQDIKTWGTFAELIPQA